jgi:hypothetical protein
MLAAELPVAGAVYIASLFLLRHPMRQELRRAAKVLFRR